MRACEQSTRAARRVKVAAAIVVVILIEKPVPLAGLVPHAQLPQLHENVSRLNENIFIMNKSVHNEMITSQLNENVHS